MFVDELDLIVRGGRGGNGALSFRREKYVPYGGPDGGDGGDGGSVYLWADPAKSSLLDLRRRKHWQAGSGMHGEGGNRHGARGEDLTVAVPPGTMVRDEEGNLLADLAVPGRRAMVAKGGAGGRGNSRFATSRRRAPRLMEKGVPGEEKRIFLELKLVAQVGLVGFPNAGKSTLLSSISAARPRVASYPFTTLAPVLGVVDGGDHGSFVAADLPGLVEGAHRGTGLGHRFLRHVERNLLLVQVIDLSPEADPDPVEAYKLLNRELALYSEKLAAYPRVVAGNKLDLPGARDNLERLAETVYADSGTDAAVWGISAATGKGVKELVLHLAQQVAGLRKKAAPLVDEPVTYTAGKDEGPPFEVTVEKENGLAVYRVRGQKAEKLAAQTDFENEEAARRFHIYCQRSGLEGELVKQGIEDGDTVRIGAIEFNYYAEYKEST